MQQVKPEIETFAKIKVVGVGGSGGSAVDRMVKAGIRGVEFIVMNTDVQALHQNSASKKIHIGKTITRGLGSGMNPEMGKRSAEEAQNEIREVLKDADMVFITCGLGGGTGSGAGPVIASIAREVGALTVAVVTRPFSFEGPQRKSIAEGAYNELSQHVDTIITIPNDRVLQIIDKKTSLLDAFKIVDDVLRQGVQGISELITVPGLINVDFADVKAIMENTGSALMGIGIGSGDTRAVEAAQKAISSPLLELSIDGASGILFTITGGKNLGMQEVAEAAKVITSSAHEDVRVIFGAVIDDTMGEDIRVTVIATGFDDETRKRTFTAEDEFTSPFPTSKKPAFASAAARQSLASAKVPDNVQERPVPTIKKTANFGTPKSGSLSPQFTQKKSSRSFVRTPVGTVPGAVQQPAAGEKSDVPEEDLEIPAFIRKKMGT